MRLPYADAETDIAGPNLTPVIDIVFLLLIFFLVATRFEEEEKDAAVILPVVAEAQPKSMPPKQLVVNVRKDGQYTVQQKIRTETQLEAILQQFSDANPGTQDVLIRADADTMWKYGLRVMGLCNKAKIYKYRVAMVERK